MSRGFAKVFEKIFMPGKLLVFTKCTYAVYRDEIKMALFCMLSGVNCG
jgi:hypothetical protein